MVVGKLVFSVVVVVATRTISRFLAHCTGLNWTELNSKGKSGFKVGWHCSRCSAVGSFGLGPLWQRASRLSKGRGHSSKSNGKSSLVSRGGTYRGVFVAADRARNRNVVRRRRRRRCRQKSRLRIFAGFDFGRGKRVSMGFGFGDVRKLSGL